MKVIEHMNVIDTLSDQISALLDLINVQMIVLIYQA